jgi:hypothetical protein
MYVGYINKQLLNSFTYTSGQKHFSKNKIFCHFKVFGQNFFSLLPDPASLFVFGCMTK